MIQIYLLHNSPLVILRLLIIEFKLSHSSLVVPHQSCAGKHFQIFEIINFQFFHSTAKQRLFLTTIVIDYFFRFFYNCSTLIFYYSHIFKKRSRYKKTEVVFFFSLIVSYYCRSGGGCLYIYTTNVAKLANKSCIYFTQGLHLCGMRKKGKAKEKFIFEHARQTSQVT